MNALNSTLGIIAITFLVLLPICVIYPLTLVTSSLFAKKRALSLSWKTRCVVNMIQVSAYIAAILLIIILFTEIVRDFIGVMMTHTFATLVTVLVGKLLYQKFSDLHSPHAWHMSLVVTLSIAGVFIGVGLVLAVLGTVL